MADSSYQIVLGLMSGTSLDGIDLAMCRFHDTTTGVGYTLLAAETIPYPYYMREKLEDVLHLSTENMHELDQELGSYYAAQIKQFIRKHGIQPGLIASHGHTALHQPDKGITLQIGDGSVMAKETGIMVVSDFRIQDVSKGGQGAPLVPVGDKDLFGEYTFCLNLGGIANVSFDLDGRRVACDIVPCNMALNTIASWIRMEYDNRGEVASTGKTDTGLLNRLNSIGYYNQPLPKSLGKEWFLRQFLPEIKNTNLAIEDKLKTVNVHIATQISAFINRFVKPGSRILATGGGVYNDYLMNQIRNNCKAGLIIPDEKLVNFKEAIVFAYLGLLKMRNQINVFASVTGARSDTSAGTIYQPN
jgi:anhydro-N-acetylmuramic acid kinase